MYFEYHQLLLSDQILLQDQFETSNKDHIYSVQQFEFRDQGFVGVSGDSERLQVFQITYSEQGVQVGKSQKKDGGSNSESLLNLQ